MSAESTRQQIKLIDAISQLLCFCWSIIGFIVWFGTVWFINKSDQQSPLLIAAALLALLNAVPFSIYGLLVVSSLFKWLGWKTLSAKIHTTGRLRKLSIVILIPSIPALLYWTTCAGLQFVAGNQLQANDEPGFRSTISTLAALEEAVAGPVAAGYLFNQEGDKYFESKNAGAAEWCWQQSLEKWLASSAKTDCMPALTLDNLGELAMLQGSLDKAQGYFDRALSIADAWPDEELLKTPPSTRLPYFQARWRALFGLSRIAESKNDLRKASELYERTLAAEQYIDDLNSEVAAGSLAILASIYLRLEDLSNAEKLKDKALQYQQRAVGLSLVKGVPGNFSERAQSALHYYATILAANGKLKEAKELDQTLTAIQKARRHELNLSKAQLDQLVDFISGATKKLVDIKYGTNSAKAAEKQLAGRDFSSNAKVDLRTFQRSAEWMRSASFGSKSLAARIDQLSVSNKAVGSTIPVVAIGKAMIENKNGSYSEARFRFKYLIAPAGGGDVHPTIVSFDDSTSSLATLDD